MSGELSDREEVPSKRRCYCGHCSLYAGYSTFYRHRNKFFDSATNQWATGEVDPGPTEMVEVSQREPDAVKKNNSSEIGITDHETQSSFEEEVYSEDLGGN